MPEMLCAFLKDGEKSHKKKHKHRHGKHKEKKAKMKHVVLFICDPQCDFLKEGPLPIPKSKQDSIRISDMIMNNIHEITEIYVSLDSRHKTHISNPISWVDNAGDTPAPYTVIKQEDVEKGVFRARMKVLQDSFLEYVTALADNKREPLILWPEHCLVGTEGHAIVPEINEALQEWAGKNMATVEYIIKATNVATEMYSAISAEVAQPEDPATALDLVMVERLSLTDRVLVCGQSLSHTVNHTMRDLTTHWKTGKMDKLYLLDDCTSPLPGFESVAEEFLLEMREKGVVVTPSPEAFNWDSPGKAIDGSELNQDQSPAAETTPDLSAAQDNSGDDTKDKEEVEKGESSGANEEDSTSAPVEGGGEANP